jgi:deoxyribodipyrimidine photolyase
LQPDLYRRNLKGIAAYLFSLDTARESLWVSLHGIKPIAEAAHALAAAQYLKFYVEQVDELNTLPRYTDLPLFYNSTNALSAFATAMKMPKESHARYNYPVLVHDFDRDTFSVIKNHPDVQFIVFFLPYSILQPVAIRERAPKALQTLYEFNKYMLRNLAAQPNFMVFDFLDAGEITHDLSNYLDLVHHSPNIDQKVLGFFATGKHELDRSAPTASSSA